MTAPMLMIARSAITHSGRLSATSATRSPGSMPIDTQAARQPSHLPGRFGPGERPVDPVALRPQKRPIAAPLCRHRRTSPAGCGRSRNPCSCCSPRVGASGWRSLGRAPYPAGHNIVPVRDLGSDALGQSGRGGRRSRRRSVRCRNGISRISIPAATAPNCGAIWRRSLPRRRRSGRRYESRLAALSGGELGAAVARIRAAAGDRRPNHELRRSAARRQCRRPRDRALLPDDARAHQRGRDRAAVLRARDQPARRRRARREAGRPGAGALPAVAARRARDAAAPAQRRAGKDIARKIGRRPRRVGAAVRRDDRRIALSVPRPRADRGRGDAPVVRPGRRGAARGGAVDRRGARQKRPRLRADHQHARQGQGDRGPLAQIPAADLGAQPVELRRGRGRRCADRGGARQLPEPVAPLLPAEGALVRRRATAVLGPQRAAARRCRPHARLERGARHGAVGLSRVLAGAGRGRRKISSRGPGSTRRCGRASRRAPSRIRPCRARIRICC